MTGQGKERRKHKRFNMDAEIYFDFIYDLETKVEYELIDKKQEKPLSEKYSAISRNVSVGGLCFVGTKEVKQDDLLHMEVYVPRAKKPIHMKGETVWCKPATPTYQDLIIADVEGKRYFEVGVRLLEVNGVSVDESIHHDPTYDVDWSVVLESIFGNFKMLMEGDYRRDE